MRYLSDSERIWSRLKTIAAALSTRDAALDEDEARSIVDRVISEERATSTPPEAREYFATELRRMAVPLQTADQNRGGH